MSESDGAMLAREAWEAWCENEAALNDALEARAARYHAKAATYAVHQAILAARGYRYYDRQRMQSPELMVTRGAERVAEITEQRAWDYAHQAYDWAADSLALYYDWTRLFPEDMQALTKVLNLRRRLGAPPVDLKTCWAVGDEVRHRVFGVGRVLAVDGAEVVVEFRDGCGTPFEKHLIAQYARLERA